MNAMHNEPSELVPSAALAPSPPLLRTLVALDLVESTALTEQLGDRSIADFMHQLDRHTRDLLERHGGIEIDKTDGFLLMFERPIPAIAFALDYQRLLHDLSLSEFLPLKARVGIHVGDVVLWRNAVNDIARGAKPVEVEGLVKPVAARLMGLALPGQILMSGIARALALRAQDELQTEFPPQWRMHGRYCFKGVAEPLPVFEVGEPGIAPLRSPAYSNKAFREVPWWRRPSTIAVEVLILASAILVPAWFFLRSPPVIAFAERDWVVVGNLKNLTEEHRFDDSVDTAFRLGLEQSRYVNVLSDLKVRETVGLMQRDPDKTVVDRAIGSEVAVRDGARALILPTVAEVGHNVRVTAEVIDPQSQTTVYTESADGVGVDSVLASVDLINQRLRGRLGETLASISKDSQPLDKVATKSIDALRAFWLGQNSYESGKYEESMKLYGEALRLDPNFALARVGLARCLLVVDRKQQALAEMDKAVQDRDRLSPRESLYVEAWRLTLGRGTQRESLDKLRLLVKLYPDFFTGQSMFAYFSFEFANRFGEEVVAAAEHAASPLNPHPLNNQRMLGLLYLANEQYDRAIQKLTDFDQRSGSKHFVTAFPYAAQRAFDKADAALEASRSSDSSHVIGFMPQIALAVDEGKHELARSLVGEARTSAAKSDTHFALIYAGVELSLRVFLASSENHSAAIAAYAKNARDALAKAEISYRPDAQFQMLLAAYLASHAGDATLANGLLADVGPEPASGDYPVLTKMLILAQAQTLLSENRPDDAIARTKAAIDGTELYASHALLMEAYLANGDMQSALLEARWLAAHRGRAYTENNMQGMLMPLNVALSNIARDRLQASVPPK